MASVIKRNDKYVVRYDYKDSKGKRRQKWEEFNTKNEANKFKTEIELKKLNVKLVLEDIKNETLHLIVHLAFVCSLRIGEILSITWENINFEDHSIIINKTLQRVSQDAVELLPKSFLFKTFKPKNRKSKSVLMLKKPKTDLSNRIVFMSDEVNTELLKYRQKYENELFEYDDEYKDSALIFRLKDGYPIEPKICEKWFNKWQNQTTLELPKVTFHSLRHSSTTYKLMVSKGDIKSVQGDTGHATADMVVNRYSHVKDESRKNMLKLLENDFYSDEGK